MSKDILWQPWITLKGASAATVNQPVAYYLDLSGLREAQIRLEIRKLSSFTTIYVKLETSSTISGPWNELFTTATPTPETVLSLSTDPNADYILQRYVRWSIVSESSDWIATFQISVKTKDLRGAHYRTSFVESGEVQPWTTIAGGATISDIIPLESAWIDTRGMEKLSLQVEVIQLANATLRIQKAMSLEGPWTNATNFTATGSTLCFFETDAGATLKMERYIRWSLDGTVDPWNLCFRINARSWP